MVKRDWSISPRSGENFGNSGAQRGGGVREARPGQEGGGGGRTEPPRLRRNAPPERQIYSRGVSYSHARDFAFDSNATRRPRAPLLLTMLRLLLALGSAALLAPAHCGAEAAAERRLSWAAGADEDRLPGWKGEVSRKARPATLGQQHQKEDRERGTWVELLSWRPRAYVIHNFMSPEEALLVIKTARPFMTRSTVVDSVTGESKVDPIRTRRAPALSLRARTHVCLTRPLPRQRANLPPPGPVRDCDAPGGAPPALSSPPPSAPAHSARRNGWHDSPCCPGRTGKTCRS